MRVKNLTLRIDEKTLAAARKVAALRGTTVAKLVREFLEKLVAENGVPADETAAQRKERPSPLGGDRSAASGFAEAPLGEEGGASAADDALFRALTTVTDEPPESGHDEWFRRQVQTTLDKKKAGKMKYSSLAQVAARYGFNAR